MTSNSSTVRVGLVQINNSFSGQTYFPYSVGVLEAYARKWAARPQRYHFLLPIYRRMAVEEAVGRLLQADVAALSLYAWNEKLSLDIARRLKARKPEMLIVLGGPQVPDRVEPFLRNHPFVDVTCHGEGEATFLGVLEAWPDRCWDHLPAVSYIRPDGTLAAYREKPRIQDLSTIPSPYLEGVFDPLLAAEKGTTWLGLWETNRGCPFQCSYCDWGSATLAKVHTFDMERLRREIDWFAEHEVEFIFCCDANFGILPRDLDIVHHVARVKQERGYPRAFSVQNTKNATERAYQVEKTLADHGLNKGVTLSLQTVSAEALANIRRQNISLETFFELQRRFTRDRVTTYSDLILALPGETYESFVDGVDRVIAMGQHNRIQFNNLCILPNAEMGDPEYQERHGIKAIESKIINLHGKLTQGEDDPGETQQLVIATRTMPEKDWVRARVFCWTTALLHFDKLLQIPAILLHQTAGLPYRTLFDAFAAGDLRRYSLLHQLQTFFFEQARRIQQGGPEYVHAPDWLDIWWPVDEYVFIMLCRQGKLDEFFTESQGLLSELLVQESLDLPARRLEEAIRLNRSLVILPGPTDPLHVETSCNLWEFYRSVLDGAPIQLDDRPSRYCIDRSNTVSTWDQWYQEVVWYGNKKGAYLYENVSRESLTED